MFNSITAYFLFVIPCTILLALGIIFEDKLINFEENVSDFLKKSIKNFLKSFRQSKAQTNFKQERKTTDTHANFKQTRKITDTHANIFEFSA